jgi:8-amino-7-oxononanoate synthase/dethiobiotin synthase
MTTWVQWRDHTLAEIGCAGRWRAVRTLEAAGPEGRLVDEDRPVVSFASNDYLGLANHPAVIAAAHQALDRWGAGAGASRLIVGSRPVHRDLELALAEWKSTEAALVFPTGYAANLGLLTALGGPGVTICSDALNHASIVDGCRLARASVQVYDHGDLDHLASLMSASDARVVVVSDSVFSMDGDAADLEGLSRLCGRHRALLVLDEAHAVLGPDASGLEHEVELLRVGTLSKTLGSLGGFVAGARRWIELLVNHARPFIFTTAPTPADSAAALAAVDVVRSSEGAALHHRLRAHVDAVRPGHSSPIVPVVLGDEATAVRAADALLEQGLLVPAIRPPTVPPGSSRLRVTLSAAHTRDQVETLVGAIRHLELMTAGGGAGAHRPSVLFENRGGRGWGRARGGEAASNAALGRPDCLVLVLGTATEVGKTWVAARLVERLRQDGRRVAVRKPVQSFEPGAPTDAEVLAYASGEPAEEVCPPHRWYPLAMAPPMAVEALGGATFTISDLVGELTWPDGVEVGVVEGVGGVRSPMAADGDSTALAAALQPDVIVLVADAGLGVLNLVRLSAGAVDHHGLVVHLNRFDPHDDLQRRNREWLDGDGLSVETSLEAVADCVSRRR